MQDVNEGVRGESPLLWARGLRRSWRTRGGSSEVLRGIDLRVSAGEYVAIRGPSGSGKSTLLRILGVLDSGYEGEVLVSGRSLRGMTDRERSRLRATTFSFVFQSFMLLSHLTVLENLMLPSLWLPDQVPAPDVLRARAVSLLERVGVSDKIEAMPDSLSGGQQQRVAIARALMMRPRAILCDEPTGSLDSATSVKVLELLEQARAEFGMTLVIVTHDPAVMVRADRQIELVDGCVLHDSGCRSSAGGEA